MIGSIAEPPAATRAHRGDELVDVADPVLEQVADALGGVGQQLHRQAELDVLREHEHADAGVLARISSAARRPSSVCVGGSRMSTIDHVGLVGVAPCASSSSASPHWATTSKPASLEQAGEALAQQHAVLGDRYPHGISARTRVPPPRRGSRPAAGRRAPRPGRRGRAGRVPRSVSAPPTPSSTISTTSWPSRRATSTVADGRPARACRRWRGSRRRRSRRPPRPPRDAGRRASTVSRTGTGAGAASDSSATARPCPLSTAGWRPRATSRSSSSETAISSRAPSSPRPARRGRRRAGSPSMPRSSESATSRCWAPSCRLRSSRWRSRCPASIDPGPRARSSSRRARSSACSRPFSSAIAGRGGDRVEQLRLVGQRRVVHERGDVLAVALDQGHRPLVVRAGRLDRLAVLVGPGLELGQPVRERQRRVAQRPGERRRAGPPAAALPAARPPGRRPTARASRASSSATRKTIGARPMSEERDPLDREEERRLDRERRPTGAGRRSPSSRPRTSRPAGTASAAAAGPRGGGARRGRRSPRSPCPREPRAGSRTAAGRARARTQRRGRCRD